MPRNHSRASARPSPAARPAPVNTAAPKRDASAMAAPAQPAVVHVPQQQGVLSQIATTAAGVATGQLLVRMIGGVFSGGAPAAEAAAAGSPVDQASGGMLNMTKSVAPQCQEYSRLFLQCMEQNENHFGTCKDYMDMMKACQQQYSSAAS